MTWFDDLTPYSYLAAQEPRPALNVGWLDHGHPFPTGDVPARFVTRLEALHTHGQTQATRGKHHCDLCSSRDREGEWGCAELRAVGADGTRFAAPSLVLHYVTEHRYLPPRAFVDAVLRFEIEWSRAESSDLCISCGGNMQRVKTIDGLVRGPNRDPVIAVYFRCERCGVDYSRAFPDPSRARPGGLR